MKNNNSNPNINSGMTQEQFQLEAGRFFWSKVMPLLKQKGAQYSTQKAFANFEEGSALHRITPGKYLMIQATKHWHNLCKNPDNNVAERCTDIIIYMLLLIMMTKENEDGNK